MILREPVLVTGATGFLGTALMTRLRSSGVNTVGVSRRPAPAGDTLICDLEDAASVERLFNQEKPRTVVHLASQVSGARDLEAVLSTFRGTLSTTVHVLVAASGAGVQRVVLAGSMEDQPLAQAPRYPYAAAKRAATEYGLLFNSAFGLPTAIARIGMVYGPGQRTITRLVPHVILAQLAGTRPRLSSGKRKVDWIFIEDVVDGLLAMAAADADSVAGMSIDLGSGQETSVADVAALITTITGGPAAELGALPERFKDPDIALDVWETKRLLGWQSRVSLEQGLRRTVDWYREARATGSL